MIDQIVAMRTDRPDVVLVSGEPGIGKSRVLAHIGERLTSAGGHAFTARAYEAEAMRPYGIWIDVIREILRESPRDGVPADLGLLLPEVGAVPEAGDRTRLLDAVLGLLRQVVSVQSAAVILDDLYWADEGSSLAPSLRRAPCRYHLRSTDRLCGASGRNRRQYRSVARIALVGPGRAADRDQAYGHERSGNGAAHPAGRPVTRRGQDLCRKRRQPAVQSGARPCTAGTRGPGIHRSPNRRPTRAAC